MKHSFKKLTAWLCCMAMLISFIPATALPVFAEEGETEPEWTVIEVTQTEGELPALEDENSSYELVSDLTLTGDLTFPTYVTVEGEVTVDLNGHNLIAGETADGGVFAVDAAESHLIITDSVGTGRVVSGVSTGTPAIQVQAGTFTLEAGEITGWNREGGAGGMIFLAADTTFNMEGGKLTGANGGYGSAIRVNGAGAVVNMNGGEITGNTASGRAVIWMAAGTTFNMTGGEISGNTKAPYAGVFDTAGEVNISGGVIEADVDGNGGVLYMQAGATATISGGELTGSGKDGGVIHMAGTSTLTVSDKAVITGTATGYGGAIYASNKNCTINIEGGTISGTANKGGAISMQESWTNGDNRNELTISGGSVTGTATTTSTGAIAGYAANFEMTGGEVGNIWLRHAQADISGGTIAQLVARPDAAGTDAYLKITGNPVIVYNANDLIIKEYTMTATIGELTEGASVRCPGKNLTMLDGAVKLDGEYYIYQEKKLPEKGAVGADEYVLKDDMTLTGTLNVTDVDVVIDLAGNTITAASGGGAFAVYGTGNLTIKDSIGGGKVVSGVSGGTPAVSIQGGTFTLEGGEITGWNREGGAGGMIFLAADTTFNMKGGKLTNANGGYGSAIRVNAAGAVVNMSGGEISGNKATGSYGPIILAAGSTFNMTGGIITDNQGVNGGAIGMNGAATVNISGDAVISDNTATTAGGAVAMFYGATFTMDGGSITGNEAQNGFGGAIYLDAASSNKTGTITVNGGEITGNTASGNGGAIGLNNTSAGTVTINGGTLTGNTAGRGNAIHMGEGQASVLNLNGGTTDFDNTAYGGVYSHTGTINVTGGTYEKIYMRVGTINISGNPVINCTTNNNGGVRVSDGAVANVSNLTSGAYVHTWDTATATVAENDETVYTADNRNYIYVGDKPVAVEVVETAGGSVTVDPTSGKVGTIVTVTATADEGYELEAILVNGKAIDGNTFAIVAGENVVSATFKATDIALPTSGSVAAGEYVLEEDLVLTGALSVTNAEVVIDLAGHTITAAEGGGVISLNDANSKLTIKDGVGGGKIVSGVSGGTPAVSIQGGTFTLEGGEITGWNRADGPGGMIFLAADTTFNMKGGKLTGANAGYGSAIRVNAAGATVNMSGGEISGNTATNSYGPIYLMTGAEFNMTGGTITGNTGVNGGAIGTYGAATVTVSGDAVISNNTATKAGGAVWLAPGSTFTMDNGAITGNEAKDGFGGAIYLEAVSANRTGTITVNGGSITDNTASGKGGAIGLADGSAGTVTINGGTLTGNAAARGKAIHMGEGQPSVLNLNGGTTDYDDTTYGGIYSHTGTINITGGTHPFVYMRVGTVTISGNPVISNYLRVSDGATATIGSLTTGASVRTWTADTLTIAEGDDTVYTENNRNYIFAGDVNKTYTVVVVNPLGGEVSVDKNEAAEGETITVTAKAADGYELKAILVNGAAIEGNTFVMPAADVQVSATFAEIVPEGFPTTGTIPAGTYVLEEDVTLTGTLEVKANTEVVIDLNGHTISGATFPMIWTVGTLTVKDSTATGTPGVDYKSGAIMATAPNTNDDVYGMVYVTGGIFNLEGGLLTGYKYEGAKNRGGAVAVINDADFNMTGGEISGNTGNNGGGVHVQATSDASPVEITVGGNAAIVNNKAIGYGGAIYASHGSKETISTIISIEDNAVINGTAARGGGIASAESWADVGRVKLNVTGGTIGGTIEATGAISAIANTNAIGAYAMDLTVTGGTITGNTWARHAKTEVSGGNIATLIVRPEVGKTGSYVDISGNPTINSLYVDLTVADKDGNTGTMESATIGALTSGASINAVYADRLTVKDDTVHTTDGKTYYCKADLGFGDKFVPGATVTLTEDTSVGAGVQLTAAGEYTLDLAGFELTGNAAPYFTIAAGAKLTIIDSSEGKTGKIVGLAEAAKAMIQVNGEFVLAGGTLTGHHNNAVALGKGAAMTMTGGEISGNYANRGAAVTSGDVTNSGVYFTMTGGIIKDNVCTGTSYRGANLYMFDPAMVTLAEGATIGGAYIQNEDGSLTLVPLTSPVHNAEIRGGNAAITGGTYKQLCLSKSSVNVTATISGAPKVELMSANLSNTTIGNLTTGARIAVDTNFPLTIAEGDKTVSAQARLYRYAGDVKSILFVANSFGGDTIKFLSSLGSIYGIEIDAAGLYVGSQSIRWHAQSLEESLRNTDLNGDGVIGDSRDRVEDGLYTCAGFSGYVDIPTVLEGKKWDYVVLQNGVEYVGFEGTYNSDVDFLMDYIADVQPDAKILFSQTWAVDNRSWSTQVNPDAPESVEQGGQWLAKSSYLTQFGGSQEVMYDAILRSTDVNFAGADARFDVDGYLPIGIAVQTMRQNYTDSYLTRDGFHLSHNAGRMIAGLTTLKTLFPEIDLSEVTAEKMAAMFAANTENTNASAHLQDAFVANEANVATLLAAVETACGYAAAGTVPAYGDGTANKQFNPDAAGAYVAVYEGITEVGQAATNEKYATTGAGKIVIYKDGVKTAAIDELWLEANAGIVLTDRYNKVVNGEDYSIQADPQDPQLAIIGSTLYLTFDVKLYGAAQNTITNGGIYLTTSTDGKTWTPAVKVSDAPMAYGLTALSDGNLILSIADTTTKAVKISKAGDVVSSVELENTVADVAFAEVGANVYALSSTGALYVSADKGLTWTATGVANGASASPDLVVMSAAKGAVYASWSDEAALKIYGKLWTVDTTAADYGWGNIEASVIAEYTPATAYNGKTTGGQPTTVLTATATYTATVKTVYTSGNKLAETESYSILTAVGHSLALESSLTVKFMFPKNEMDALGATMVKVVASNPAAGVEPTVVKIDELGETFKSGGVVYYCVSIDRAAKEMGDSLVAVAYDADGNQLSFEDKYSVRAYIDSQMAKVASVNAGTKDAVKRTLFVDLLNYGAAAQTYFGYAQSALVNAHLTAEQKAWASNELVLDVNLVENNPVNTTNGITSGKTLSAEAVVEVTLNYLASTVTNPGYVKISYTTHDGKVVDNVRYELTDYKSGGKLFKQARVNTLATADVSTKILCDLYDTNDNFIEGSHIEYSIETFCYSQVKNDKPVAPVCMALMQAGKTAHAFFHYGE